MKFWLILTMLFSFFNTIVPITNHNFSKIETKVEPIPGTNGEAISLAVDLQNNIYIGTTKAVFRKLATKDSFALIAGPTGEVWSLIIDSKNNIYATSNNVSTNNGKVCKSTAGQPFIEVTGTSGEIRSLAVDSQNTIYAGTNTGVYKKLATRDSFDSTPMVGTTGKIFSLAVDSQNTIYAGTNTNNDADNGKTYKSTAGQPFIEVTGTSGEIRSLVLSPNDSTVYAGTTKGVYKKTKYKVNFDSTPMLGTTKIVRSLAVDSQNTIYAGTNTGVYKKLATKDSFDSTPIINGTVVFLTVDSQNNIYVGTTNGVYKIIFENSKFYLEIVIGTAVGIFVVVSLLITLIIYKVKNKTKTIA